MLDLLILGLLRDAENISQMAGTSHNLFELRVTLLVVSMSLFLLMLVVEARYWEAFSRSAEHGWVAQTESKQPVALPPRAGCLWSGADARISAYQN